MKLPTQHCTVKLPTQHCTVKLLTQHSINSIMKLLTQHCTVKPAHKQLHAAPPFESRAKPLPPPPRRTWGWSAVRTGPPPTPQSPPRRSPWLRGQARQPPPGSPPCGGALAAGGRTRRSRSRRSDHAPPVVNKACFQKIRSEAVTVRKRSQFQPRSGDWCKCFFFCVCACTCMHVCVCVSMNICTCVYSHSAYERLTLVTRHCWQTGDI